MLPAYYQRDVGLVTFTDPTMPFPYSTTTLHVRQMLEVVDDHDCGCEEDVGGFYDDDYEEWECDKCYVFEATDLDDPEVTVK